MIPGQHFGKNQVNHEFPSHWHQFIGNFWGMFSVFLCISVEPKGLQSSLQPNKVMPLRSLFPNMPLSLDTLPRYTVWPWPGSLRSRLWHHTRADEGPQCFALYCPPLPSNQLGEVRDCAIRWSVPLSETWAPRSWSWPHPIASLLKLHDAKLAAGGQVGTQQQCIVCAVNLKQTWKLVP